MIVIRIMDCDGLGMLIFKDIVTFNHFTRSGYIVLLHMYMYPFVLRLFIKLGIQTSIVLKFGSNNLLQS